MQKPASDHSDRSIRSESDRTVHIAAASAKAPKHSPAALAQREYSRLIESLGRFALVEREDLCQCYHRRLLLKPEYSHVINLALVASKPSNKY
jgi:hypothetical protein